MTLTEYAVHEGKCEKDFKAWQAEEQKLRDKSPSSIQKEWLRASKIEEEAENE